MDRALILVTLLALSACTSPEDGSGPPGQTSPGDSGSSTGPYSPIPLTSPADAIDQDPDPNVFHTVLIPRPQTHPIGDWVIEGYAYNEQLPGPTLRLEVGQELVVDLINELDVPTTLHWHGMEVPWDMDGSTWMMEPIQPGEQFTIRFPVQHAGTFWYHPHFDTANQVDRGLYGVVVVTDPAEPTVDQDEVWVLDVWSETHTDPNAEHSHSHLPDPTPSHWTVNGQVVPTWAPDPDATTRVRLLNASNGGYLSLEDVEVVGTDQGLLGQVENSAILGPGDRVELDLGNWSGVLETARYAVAGGPAWGDPLPLVQGPETPIGTATDWGLSTTAPSADPGTTDVVWVLHGDGQTETWMINGEVFPEVTIPEVGRAETAVIEVRNLSAAEHPFHLHGQSFEVLSIDGVPPNHRWVEDTLNVGIRQTLRLQVTNPTSGDWMAHCHILGHAEQGMMTLLRVGETP